jgi:hypothetical protein
MTRTTETFAFRVSEKDILAFQGGNLEDGSAFMEVHVAGGIHRVRAEWSVEQQKSGWANFRVSVDDEPAENVTWSIGGLSGPAGPWEPRFEGPAPTITIFQEHTAEIAPTDPSGGGGSLLEQVLGAIGAAIGAAIGGAVGGAGGAAVGGAVGYGAGTAAARWIKTKM